MTYEHSSRISRTDDPNPGLVDAADQLMRAELRNGHFVIGVRCRACGAVLTAPTSMRRGIGPDCRRREGAS